MDRRPSPCPDNEVIPEWISLIADVWSLVPWDQTSLWGTGTSSQRTGAVCEFKLLILRGWVCAESTGFFPHYASQHSIHLVYTYIQLYLWDPTLIINVIDLQQFIKLNTSAIACMHDVRILDPFPTDGDSLAVWVLSVSNRSSSTTWRGMFICSSLC